MGGARRAADRALGCGAHGFLRCVQQLVDVGFYVADLSGLSHPGPARQAGAAQGRSPAPRDGQASQGGHGGVLTPAELQLAGPSSSSSDEGEGGPEGGRPGHQDLQGTVHIWGRHILHRRDRPTQAAVWMLVVNAAMTHLAIVGGATHSQGKHHVCITQGTPPCPLHA